MSLLGIILLSAQAHAVTAGEVSAIVHRVEAIYAPMVSAENRKFIIKIKKDSPSVAASAERDRDLNYVLSIHSGLLKSPRLTPDSFRVVLCHELGHLFGGMPQRPPPEGWDGPVDPEAGLMYISGEGQADYYATAVCFRKVTQGEDHRAALRGKTIPAAVRTACPTPVCMRAAMASFEFLNLVMDFPIFFETPDPHIAPRTFVEYPSRQCRLDTLFRGSLCEMDLSLDLRRAQKRECEGSFERPACWLRRDSPHGQAPKHR